METDVVAHFIDEEAALQERIKSYEPVIVLKNQPPIERFEAVWAGGLALLGAEEESYGGVVDGHAVTAKGIPFFVKLELRRSAEPARRLVMAEWFSGYDCHRVGNYQAIRDTDLATSVHSGGTLISLALIEQSVASARTLRAERPSLQSVPKIFEQAQCA